MAGGPVLPTSTVFVTAGNVYPTTYIPATNTSSAGHFEAVGVVASLAADSDVVMQFDLPQVLPSGTAKIRALSAANATSGVGKCTLRTGVTAAGSNPGAASMSTETQISRTWATADVWNEDKVTLTPSMVAGSVLSVRATFNTSGFTLAQASAWRFQLIWE